MVAYRTGSNPIEIGDLGSKVHISNSVKPTSFVLGTFTQQHNVNLMIKMKMTLIDDEGHRQRSKVITMN